jgi:prepilin-type N-terminal cleavage/methylation domain-containing protein
MPLNFAPASPRPRREHGFTLLELSIVLVVVALIGGGMMMSLASQQEAAASAETRQRLNDARDALLGFAATHGRLPCPAAPGSTGAESPLGGGTCSNPWDGFLPAITLGLSPTDAQGYATDGWGSPIRYALTDHPADKSNCAEHLFAKSSCLKAAWSSSPPAPDLHVCTTAIGMSGQGSEAKCAAGTMLTDSAVAVIFSRGKNGGATPHSADEVANGNADRLFVTHTPTPAGSAGEFDDIVIWLSPNILYNRLITAGRLP